jgi:predicted nucleotidyltransferase
MHAHELLDVAKDLGARRVALCGSVARGEDGDCSDLDFYVREFEEPNARNALRRADQLVKEFRRILVAYCVDVRFRGIGDRGIRGWPLSPEHDASMNKDAIDLNELPDMFQPRSNG